MRKSLIGLVLTLSLSTLPAFSANTPKAGSVCNKKGVTKTYKGIEFKCIKKGGKLVWSKGKVVNKESSVAAPEVTASVAPSPTPTPTPTPMPTPTPTPTPKADLGPTIGSGCKNQGESVSSGNLILVCRLVANNEKKFFELSDSFTPEINPKSPDSLATCRLRDQRSEPIQPEGTQIAYPITPRFGSVKAGVQKIAVVGFDFEDSPGSGSPLDIFGTNLQKSQEFFDWYSNGKVKLAITTYEKWIRLKNPTASYKTGEHFSSLPGSLTVLEMAQEFHLAINKYMNLDGYSSVWFVYPRDVKNIQENYGLAAGWNSLPSFYGIGPSSYQNESPLWTYYIHEMLHEQGLQGHSPKAPWRLGVLLNGNGYSAAINSWDELSVDWITEDEIYCVDRKHLQPIQINLAPIERKQSGVHSIMIKLDDQRILVIESHRKGEFSPGMPDYGYGVTLQLTDMTKITTWDDERATSVYLKVTNQNRFGPEYGERINNPQANDSGINLFNGIGVSGARWGIDQSYLLLEGESFVFEGITIEFKKSGNTDAISIKP